jgi:formylglycine-generating enzyme required for sulfatase activity
MFSLLMVFLMLSPEVQAQFNYQTTNGQVTITRYTGAGGVVTVPSMIDGLPVTRIGDNAFEAFANITSVTIPGSVTSIGHHAFCDCTGLASITIGNGVASIGYQAFQSCTNLANVVIPDSVTSMGHHAFYNCTSLASVTMGGGVTGIGDYLFESCTRLGSITIPDNVISIGNWTFSGCANLASVMIGNGVTSIGTGAFDSCVSLTGVVIPASVTSIGNQAFYKCSSLTVIAIPDLVTSIGENVFNSCISLSGITIGSGVTSIGDNAFGGCTSLASITIPGSVTSIGNYAFLGCTNLAGMMLGNGVISIGRQAFQSCHSLASLTIPDSVTSIGQLAFYDCSSLTNATIGSGVTSIGDYAFHFCTSLASITIPDNVTSIGNWTFSGCASLASVVIGNGVTSIGGHVFQSCSSLITVAIGNSVISIGDFAFYLCTSLPGIIIPGSVTSLGDYAFHKCSSLTRVTIPGGVTRIGAEAFESCNSLASAFFMGNAPSMGLNVFNDVTSGFTVYYFDGAAGFASPTWMGYPSVNMGGSSPTATWLLSHGLPYDANLQSDPNDDGVSLLLAYALDMDPNENLADSMPKPVSAGGEMKMTFYAGAEGVTYAVETSTDLQVWTTVGVDLSLPDANGFRTASVPMNAPRRFLRLVVGQISDPPTPDGFSLIPAGSFQMGDQSDPLVGVSDELPAHSVYVNAFHMGKYEVTKALWDEVRIWGSNNGYTDLPAGGGKAANHPVHTVNWYAMVKWCNARSQKEGLIPCYTVSGSIYKTGSSAPDCNWNANGYRLPTEAEWEKAARGGLSSKNFPWGDTISHNQANFWNSGAESYQSGSTGPHPTYNNGVYPYSSPVGIFAPNGYGLYDMAGNMWESCWDWYGGYSSASQSNPRGPGAGSLRVIRGGSWGNYAHYCRIAFRNNYELGPDYSGNGNGFRIARSVSMPQEVATGNVTGVTEATVTLHGMVNPNGYAATAQFEYGLTTAYGGTAAVTLTPDDGMTAQSVSANLSNLLSGKTYHYRLTATNSSGMVLGVDMTFTSAGTSSPVSIWMVTNGFAADTDLQSDPNGDGVNLLKAYALNFDPKLNLGGSMPKPVIAGDQLSLTFYAGNSDVIYTAETSTDLQTWTTEGVSVSAWDANKFRAATVPIAGPSRFLRLKFTALSTLPEDQQIQALYAEMLGRVSAHDEVGFLALFSSDYLHQGQSLADQFDEPGFLDSVETFTFDITGITFTGNEAKVAGTVSLTFNNGDPAETWSEPDTAGNGGLGWLRKTPDGWRVVGDQKRASVSVQTAHSTTPGDDRYYFQMRAESSLPIAGGSVSGPGIETTELVPDLEWGGFEAFVGDFNSAECPPVGTVYTIVVRYPDGSQETYQDTVKAWVVTGPVVSVTTDAGNATIHWTDVSAAVANADHYWVFVRGTDVYWKSDELPLTQNSTAFNADGTSNAPLVAGQSYRAHVFIFDSSDNYAAMYYDFTMPLPPVPDGR